MPRRVIVVRCPKCGSTRAGETGGMYEFTYMKCHHCEHTDICDEWQIKSDWNVEITLPDDAKELPAFIPLE